MLTPVVVLLDRSPRAPRVNLQDARAGGGASRLRQLTIVNISVLTQQHTVLGLGYLRHGHARSDLQYSSQQHTRVSTPLGEPSTDNREPVREPSRKRQGPRSQLASASRACRNYKRSQLAMFLFGGTVEVTALTPPPVTACCFYFLLFRLPFTQTLLSLLINKSPEMCCVPGYVSGYAGHGHACVSLLFTIYYSYTYHVHDTRVDRCGLSPQVECAHFHLVEVGHLELVDCR